MSGLLRGELDWIVMKALDKDRGRRYETANGLAMDIQRYLSDQPVVACPPNAGYRFRKFVRRHKRLALAASITLLALLAGTTAATLGLVHAESSRRQEARQRQIAQQNATRATDNLRLAIAAVDELYTEVSENWLRATPRMQKSRRHILERALNFYQRFAELNADPALQLEMALAWRRVGEINHRFENQSESLRALEVSTSLLEKLAVESPEQSRVRHELAKTYFFRSKPLEVTRQYADAEKYARRAVQVGKELLQAAPENADYQATVALSMHQLGHILGHVGSRAEAVAEHRNSRDIYRMLRAKFPQRFQYLIQLAHAYDHLAVLLHEEGDNAQAEAESLAAIAMLEEAALRADNNADVVDSPGYLLGAAHLHFGDFLSSHERNSEAEKSYGEARILMTEQVHAFPDVGHYQLLLGKVCLSLAKLFLKEQRQEEARGLLEQALGIFVELTKVSDEVPDYRRLADETKRVLDEIDNS
ncbi:MAG: hypothetical protein MUE50_04405 [Pirellulaceae bacterium]|nr:hypothetical protein [Pirellulaceae bacterium]